MIHILGTSHIAKESVNKVKQSFKDIEPDIVALELDRNRAYSLTHNIKKPKNFELLKMLGFSGFLFYLFGQFIQEKLGKIVNIDPGAEMLTGLNLAKKNKLMVAFIDRDIQITLKRFSKHFKKRELIRMVLDMFKNPIKKEKIDFSKVPSEEIIETIINHTKKAYPSFYKILIAERDRHMAYSLLALQKLHPDKKILAVVGAGHVKGIKNILNKNFK